VVLLCSDGLHALVPDEEIAKSLAENQSLSETASALLRTAKTAGGQDNISIILFALEA
jgi:protein phosphatase